MEPEMNETAGGGGAFAATGLPGWSSFYENASLLISPNCSAFIRNLTNVSVSEIPGLAASSDHCNGSLFSPGSGLHAHNQPSNYWAHILVQILYGIVCFVGLCGNTLVIYVVVRFSKMQTVTNMYIVNLAIADECFLVGIPFLITTASLGYWPFGNIGCKAYFTSTSINQITSSMFLLIMSADRFVPKLFFSPPITDCLYLSPGWICNGYAVLMAKLSFLFRQFPPFSDFHDFLIQLVSSLWKKSFCARKVFSCDTYD